MQVSFVEHDDMVQTVAAYTADGTLAIRSLPWRARCGQDFFDAHAFHAFLEVVAVDAVAIADEKSRRFIVREGLGDLLGSPLGMRVRGDIEVNDLAPVVTHYDEDVQNAQR